MGWLRAAQPIGAHLVAAVREPGDVRGSAGALAVALQGTAGTENGFALAVPILAVPILVHSI